MKPNCGSAPTPVTATEAAASTAVAAWLMAWFGKSAALGWNGRSDGRSTPPRIAVRSSDRALACALLRCRATPPVRDLAELLPISTHTSGGQEPAASPVQPIAWPAGGRWQNGRVPVEAQCRSARRPPPRQPGRCRDGRRVEARHGSRCYPGRVERSVPFSPDRWPRGNPYQAVAISVWDTSSIKSETIREQVGGPDATECSTPFGIIGCFAGAVLCGASRSRCSTPFGIIGCFALGRFQRRRRRSSSAQRLRHHRVLRWRCSLWAPRGAGAQRLSAS